MAMTRCRECEEPVSTEASACPHCGVGEPATATVPPEVGTGDANADASGSGLDARTWLAIGGVLVAVVFAYFGYEHFFGGVTASGSQVEAEIVDRYSHLIPTEPVPLSAHCPSSVRLHKGKIVDCSVTRLDTNQTTAVFITAVDDSGHFQMQVEDPSVLIKTP